MAMTWKIHRELGCAERTCRSEGGSHFAVSYRFAVTQADYGPLERFRVDKRAGVIGWAADLAEPS